MNNATITNHFRLISNEEYNLPSNKKKLMNNAPSIFIVTLDKK